MIRQPAVAGTFYPGDPVTLRQTVNRLLETPKTPAGPERPKALIVPHAGYVYSGRVAGLAYAQLAPHAREIRRVILLGPVHRVPVRGLALPDTGSFATPLGEVPLDKEAVVRLKQLPQVVVSGAAHATEHSLEVQLPFLQSVLDDFTLVPLAVGDASAEEVAEVLEMVWGGPETLIIVSSDLSHYLPYETANRLDRDTVGKIMRGRQLENHRQACGATPINGLLRAASRHPLEPQLVSQCNSGDTSGDRTRVVGYAAIEFTERSTADLEDDERGQVLLGLARASISKALGMNFAPVRSHRWLHEKGASFVTLTQKGQLRGCIGSIEARRTLGNDVIANARAAALRDPRFSPLAAGELDLTRIEVSELSPLQPLAFSSEADALAQFRPGIDGLVLKSGGNGGTFLPQVWEKLPKPRDFLNQLKLKAGLAEDFWSDEIRLYRYHVTKWCEPEAGPTVQ